jgi:hypothetical protein
MNWYSKVLKQYADFSGRTRGRKTKKKMKQRIFKTAIIAVAAIFIAGAANAQTANSPDSVGRQLFNLLKSMNTASYSQFAEYFVNADDYRTLAQQATTDEAQQLLNDFSNTVDQGEIQKNHVYSLFSRLQKAGQQIPIDWSLIEYVDWFYSNKTANINKIKLVENACRGNLVIKYKGKYPLPVDAVVFKVNNTYKLMMVYWGDTFSKLLQTIIQGEMNTVYRNGQICTYLDGKESMCINIVDELNKEDSTDGESPAK